MSGLLAQATLPIDGLCSDACKHRRDSASCTAPNNQKPVDRGMSIARAIPGSDAGTMLVMTLPTWCDGPEFAESGGDA